MRSNARIQRGAGGRSRASSPLGQPGPARAVCLELEDHSTVRRSAVEFFALKSARDPQVQAARLADQFVTQNYSPLAMLDVTIQPEYDGNDVHLSIQAGNKVGAIPLFSPTTARLDYGMVVQPRFPWTGIGPMLAQMGWRVSPTPLRLPLLKRSERRVPLWVLSFMVLARLKLLLDALDRRFEMTSEIRSAPRGKILWADYASRNMPRAQFLSVPCRFPDLREDRLLKGAVRYSVERQLQSLETQKQHGAFVHRLIEIGQELLRRVQTVPAYIPSSTAFAVWLQRPMRTQYFVDGVQAVEWTVDERGLAGLSDLEGIPWTLPMDTFFEAWIETLMREVAQTTGAQVRTGRNRETVHPVSWDPPYLGSQKSLVPDVWLEWESLTLIVDAKYKRHWEELNQHSWRGVEQDLRERHRNDLFQVLAYANLARTPRVVACLVYPCSPQNWQSLADRGRLIHKAQIAVGSRSVHLWLTAVPMGSAIGTSISAPIVKELRAILSG